MVCPRVVASVSLTSNPGLSLHRISGTSEFVEICKEMRKYYILELEFVYVNHSRRNTEYIAFIIFFFYVNYPDLQRTSALDGNIDTVIGLLID